MIYYLIFSPNSIPKYYVIIFHVLIQTLKWFWNLELLFMKRENRRVSMGHWNFQPISISLQISTGDREWPPGPLPQYFHPLWGRKWSQLYKRFFCYENTTLYKKKISINFLFCKIQFTLSFDKVDVMTCLICHKFCDLITIDVINSFFNVFNPEKILHFNKLIDLR